MKDLFNPTCDRHGHMLTGIGATSQVMAPFAFPTAEEIALFPIGTRTAAAARLNDQLNRSRVKQAKNVVRIQRILVPVDSEHAKPVDLQRVVQLAGRFGAQVILLHCYETPRSFFYAKGKSGLDQVTRHQEIARARVRTLCSKLRRSWANCLWLFEVGPLSKCILSVSKRVRADLIVVPVPLGSISESRSADEVLDELVRKASCPILAGKSMVPPAARGADGKLSRSVI